jgi:hypothetical protein
LEIRHYSRAWTAAEIFSAVIAFGLAAFFAADVVGEYFANTSYFFALGWWYEFTIAIVTAAAGAVLAGLLYFRRR